MYYNNTLYQDTVKKCLEIYIARSVILTDGKECIQIESRKHKVLLDERLKSFRLKDASAQQDKVNKLCI